MNISICAPPPIIDVPRPPTWRKHILALENLALDYFEVSVTIICAYFPKYLCDRQRLKAR